MENTNQEEYQKKGKLGNDSFHIHINWHQKSKDGQKKRIDFLTKIRMYFQEKILI